MLASQVRDFVLEKSKQKMSLQKLGNILLKLSLIVVL